MYQLSNPFSSGLVMFLALALFFMFASAQAEPVKKAPKATSLPGYYKFFMKAGQLKRLGPEKERDKKMEQGELKAVTINKPLKNVSLPLASGKKISFSSYKGRKNLMLVSFRSWW